MTNKNDTVTKISQCEEQVSGSLGPIKTLSPAHALGASVHKADSPKQVQLHKRSRFPKVADLHAKLQAAARC